MTKGLLLDIGGVFYVGEEALPGAVEAYGRLRASGLPFRMVTNTTRSPKRAVLEKLARLGFESADGDLVTAPEAAARYLQAHDLRPHLLVHPAIGGEFAELPSEEPNAVLVGDAGEAFTYDTLNAAFRVLMEGAVLLAMAGNRYFREADGLSLDAGPFVAALEYASGQKAVMIGKPAREFFHAAAAPLGCDLGDVTMIGDDVDMDVNGAVEAGLQGVLVKTGKYKQGDEAKLAKGADVAEDFPAALARVLERD